MNKTSKIITLFLVTLTIFSGCGKESRLQDEAVENSQVEDLTGLAAYDYATEQQLIVAAKQCAAIEYYAGNTDGVISITISYSLKELTYSSFTSVVNLAWAKLGQN